MAAKDENQNTEEEDNSYPAKQGFFSMCWIPGDTVSSFWQRLKTNLRQRGASAQEIKVHESNLHMLKDDQAKLNYLTTNIVNITRSPGDPSLLNPKQRK